VEVHSQLDEVKVAAERAPPESVRADVAATAIASAPARELDRPQPTLAPADHDPRM